MNIPADTLKQQLVEALSDSDAQPGTQLDQPARDFLLASAVAAGRLA